MLLVLAVHEPSEFRGQFVMLSGRENFRRGMLLTSDESLASKWELVKLPGQPYGRFVLIIRGREDELEGKALRHGCSMAIQVSDLPEDLTNVDPHLVWQFVPATITRPPHEYASVLFCAAHLNANGAVGLHRDREGIPRVAPVHTRIGDVLGIAHFVVRREEGPERAGESFCEAEIRGTR